MQGIETVWIPGMDHAGIATQMVVEKLLWKGSKQTRYDIGRETFLEKVQEWKNEKGGVIGRYIRYVPTSNTSKNYRFVSAASSKPFEHAH